MLPIVPIPGIGIDTRWSFSIGECLHSELSHILNNAHSLAGVLKGLTVGIVSRFRRPLSSEGNEQVYLSLGASLRCSSTPRTEAHRTGRLWDQLDWRKEARMEGKPHSRSRAIGDGLVERQLRSTK